MKLIIHARPLSVNAAFRGRHFPTAEKTAYETALRYALPKTRVAPGPFYRIAFDFYLRNFYLIDYDNCIKITQDCLVKRGILDDDRLIIDARIRKFPAAADRIEVEIKAAALPPEFQAKPRGAKK